MFRFLKSKIFCVLLGVTILSSSMISTPVQAASAKLVITVKTSNIASAGTDADVQINIKGTKGSQILDLDLPGVDDFEIDSNDTYEFTVDQSKLGDLKSISILCGDGSDWHVDYIDYYYSGKTANRAFFNCWIEHGTWTSPK